MHNKLAATIACALLLYAGGIVASLPTATEDALGTDRYSIGPEWFIGINVAPVVENVLASWFK
jgi:hypothetical protein